MVDAAACADTTRPPRARARGSRPGAAGGRGGPRTARARRGRCALHLADEQAGDEEARRSRRRRRRRRSRRRTAAARVVADDREDRDRAQALDVGPEAPGRSASAVLDVGRGLRTGCAATLAHPAQYRSAPLSAAAARAPARGTERACASTSPRRAARRGRPRRRRRRPGTCRQRRTPGGCRGSRTARLGCMRASCLGLRHGVASGRVQAAGSSRCRARHSTGSYGAHRVVAQHQHRPQPPRRACGRCATQPRQCRCRTRGLLEPRRGPHDLVVGAVGGRRRGRASPGRCARARPCATGCTRGSSAAAARSRPAWPRPGRRAWSVDTSRQPRCARATRAPGTRSRRASRP